MKIKKKILSLLLSAALVLSLLPSLALPAFAASDADNYTFDITEGNITISSGSTSGTLMVSYGSSQSLDNISSSQQITITCGTNTATSQTSTANTIAVSSGTINITLSNVNIDVSSNSGACAFSIGSGATVNLTLSGTNSLKSGSDCAGLQVPSGAEVTIDKKASDTTDSLTATGGQYGAGIGGGRGGSGGTITINGGTVTANGGIDGAGIGGGAGTVGSNGTVDFGTSAGEAGGTGVNGGNGGTVTVNGGIVTAIGVNGSAGIGGGRGGNGGNGLPGGFAGMAGNGHPGGNGGTGGAGGVGGTLTITGGTVTASGSILGVGGGSGGAGGAGGDPGCDSNGTVSAAAGQYGADGTAGAAATVTITGGSVNATFGACPKNTNGTQLYMMSINGLNANSNFDCLITNGNKFYSTTDTNGKLYFWCPSGTFEAFVICVDSSEKYISSGSVAANNSNTLTAGHYFSLNAPEDVNIVGVLNGNITDVKYGKVFSIGTDNYSSSDDILIIKKEFLLNLSVGNLSLTVDFDQGNPVTLMIAITNCIPTVEGVTVSPSTVSVMQGSTKAFSSSVYGQYGPLRTVIWSVSGNSSVNTAISSDGKLTVGTGETALTLSVTATSTVDETKSGTATVTVIKKPIVTDVTVNPSATTVHIGNTQAFSASVTGLYNPAQTISWSVSGNNSGNTTISSDGVLTVGSDETATTLIVIATSTENAARSGTATVTVTTSPIVTSVTVSPSTAAIQKSNTQTFSALVLGQYNPAQTVTWSLSGNTSGNTIIGSDGKLTVGTDETAATLTVIATSTVNTARSGTATVTVTTTCGITLSQTTACAFTSQTAGYSALTPLSVTVSNAGNQATGALTAALSGKNAGSFTLSKTNIDSIDSGGTDSFAVVPNTGLSAGTYTATVTVSGGNITEKTFTVSFTVSGGGAGGIPSSGGGDSSPSSGGITVTTDNNITTSTQTITATSASNGVAAASVTSSQISEMLTAAEKKAASGAQTAVTLQVETGSGATGVSVTLPQAAVGSLTSGEASLTVSSSVAAVALDNAALAEIGRQTGGDVTISAAAADTSALSDEAKSAVGSRPVYELSVTSGGTAVSNFGGGTATVSVPYTPASGEDVNAIVVYYINASGEPVAVPNCVYDAATGTVTFATKHFSTYAVGYNKVSFSDVSGSAWYADYVAYLAARGIIGGNNGAFSPNAAITRAQFVTILARMSGDDLSGYTLTSFTDVAAADWYFASVQWANENGIATGSDGKFNPSANITREQMAAMLYRYAEYKCAVSNAEGMSAREFTDSESISSWAQASVQWAMNNGILSGNTDGSFAPQRSATRVQAAKMIAVLIQDMTK